MTSTRTHPRRRPQTGMTLIELVVVVTILAIAASLVVPMVSKLSIGADEKSPEAVVTETTLRAVARAILGSERQPGFLGDVGQMPRVIADLMEKPDWCDDWNAAVGTGWNGPYLLPAQFQYTVDAPAGFVADYGADGDPGIADGWLRPIVLQFHDPAEPDEDRYVRLLSAGPDGEVDTLTALEQPTTGERGDDILLFLKSADPGE